MMKIDEFLTKELQNVHADLEYMLGRQAAIHSVKQWLTYNHPDTLPDFLNQYKYVVNPTKTERDRGYERGIYELAITIADMSME